MLLDSTELNVGLAIFCIAMLLAVPNLEIGLIGLDFTQYSSGVHVFTRLALLSFSINFINNAIEAGE